MSIAFMWAIVVTSLVSRLQVHRHPGAPGFINDTDIGTNGADAVEVRMSASTEVTVTVNMARVPITGIQVDSTSVTWSYLSMSRMNRGRRRFQKRAHASRRTTSMEWRCLQRHAEMHVLHPVARMRLVQRSVAAGSAVSAEILR